MSWSALIRNSSQTCWSIWRKKWALCRKRYSWTASVLLYYIIYIHLYTGVGGNALLLLSFYRAMLYSAKCGLAITCRPSVRLSVCLSVMLVDHDHIGWKSWKLTARAISPTSSLFVAQRSSTYSQGNLEKFWGENLRSTPTSITSGWVESTENHVI